MSKTPFYKTGISNSPFHTDHVDVRSGEFANVTIAPDDYKAATKGTGTFGDTSSEMTYSPASITADDKVYSGKEFRDLKAGQLKSMNVQSYTDYEGKKQKLQGSFNTGNLFRSLKKSQIRSGSQDKKVDTNKRLREHIITSIKSGAKTFTHPNPKIKT
tara:strand:- start:288 stop:761 length:474 start_codon:yes stop_codon:yes gene_type:complete